MRDAEDQDRPENVADQSLRAIVLVEIVGYVAMRRAVGPEGMGPIVNGLVTRIARALAAAQITIVGRNLIELSLPLPDRAALERSIARLHALSSVAFAIGEAIHHVPLRLGIAVAPAQSAIAVDLIEAAEADLEGARNAAGADYAVTPLLAADDAAVAEELRAAIGRDELFLQYQPKLHVRRESITSVEALIRWSHPRRGLVMPGDFIPVAERSGVIGAMTLWTLEQVVKDQRVLLRAGHDLPVFVNVAGALLSDRAFVDAVLALIEESGAKLGFEITETSVIGEPERAVAHLQELAARGVAIAIDDYGAGLSSLAYLKQLPACELKIDKLFVTQLSSSHRDPLIVRSTIDLAHALEMEVVAEGVETASSLALLSVMGCDVVQGYLISRPLALNALLTFLNDEQHRVLLKRTRSPFERLDAVRARV